MTYSYLTVFLNNLNVKKKKTTNKVAFSVWSTAWESNPLRYVLQTYAYAIQPTVRNLVRRTGFEPATLSFVDLRSIQLS